MSQNFLTSVSFKGFEGGIEELSTQTTRGGSKEEGRDTGLLKEIRHLRSLTSRVE